MELKLIFPYRSATELVPKKDYELPLGKADVVVPGEDVTLIAWGTQLHVMREVAQLAQEKLGVSCEVIDMVSILPWDTETVFESVKKTGRCIVAHEAPLTNGFGAELASSIQVNNNKISKKHKTQKGEKIRESLFTF